MKSIFSALLLSAITIPASAGDGGFFLQTCVSNSGRTNLTIYQDNSSSSTVPAKIVFGIDGQFLTYAPEVGKCQDIDGKPAEDDCLNIEAEPSVVVRQGDTDILRVNFGDGDSASIERGYLDPRTMMTAEGNSEIKLTCKEFFQEP